MAQPQYHEFLRECSELRKWIQAKMVAASSQDLGQDFEHLEILINKYDSLRKEIFSGKEKLENCLVLSQRLQNPEPEVAALVANQRDEAVSEWEELVKTLEVRGKKLEAAGEIEQADAAAYSGQEGLYDLPTWKFELQFPDEPTEGAASPAMFLRVVGLIPSTDNPASPHAFDGLIRGEPLVDGSVTLSGDRLSGTMTFEGTYFEDIASSDSVSEGEVTVTFDVGTCPVEDY